MDDKLKPLTEYERSYAEEYHYLIIEFLKRSRLDIEEFYDVVVMNYLLSVQTYLNDRELQRKCNFEAVSYMYMRRALYVHFRKDKAQKRSSENEGDISLDEIDICVSDSKAMETVSNLEYMETMKEITTQLSEEQSMIGGLLQVNRL